MLVCGDSIDATKFGWCVPDNNGYAALCAMSDPETELDDIAETMEDEVTYGDMILGTPSLQLCIVAAIGLGGVMGAATRKTLDKTKTKSSAAWNSSTDKGRHSRDLDTKDVAEEDPLSIVNGLVMCAQSVSTAQFVCGRPRMGEYCYDMKHMIGTPERHRMDGATTTSILRALTKRNAVPRYVDAWLDILHAQCEIDVSNDALRSFVLDGTLGERMHTMGRILVYGMGAAPDSECSDDDSDLDSESEDTAVSYDFMEEGLFDGLLSMHLRLGGIFFKEKQSRENSTQSAEGHGESKAPNDKETANDVSVVQDTTVKKYSMLLSALPQLTSLIQDAASTSRGCTYLSLTHPLSSVFVQLFEMLSYVPVDDMINVRRVATLLRGFAVWCTVLHALRSGNFEKILECVQLALVNEKWQGLNEEMSMVDIQQHPRRNGLRQVRIPRKSDFVEIMERRKHSWVRPLKPSDKFLNEVLTSFPTVSELAAVLDEKKIDIGNVIQSDEDLLRTVLWWYGALYSLPLALKLQVNLVIIFFSYFRSYLRNCSL